jgi:ZIP family zinc transporter
MNTNVAVLARENALAIKVANRGGRWLLAVLAAVGAALFVWALVRSDMRIAYGAVASLIAGLATAAGAAPILATRAISQKAQDAMLGFGAGVMLAASAFSLIVPGIETAEALWGNRSLAAGIAAAGIAAGALFLWGADRMIPHRHFVKGVEGANARRMKQVWLFVLAITLHNFPEGLAVGVGFGAGEHAEAVGLATGIGTQNMPEGLAVALALASIGYSRLAAFMFAAATGLVELSRGYSVPPS